MSQSQSTDAASKAGVLHSLPKLLFIFSALVYALCSPGNLPGDTETRWSVARQFVRTASVALEDSLSTRNYAIGIDEKRHSVWNPGQASLFLPFTTAGKLLEASGLVSPRIADLTMQFIVSVVLFPLIGASVVLLCFYLARDFGYSERTSALVALAIGFLSPLFHYSVNTQEESQVALLLLLAIYLLQRHRLNYTLKTATSICILFGLSIFIRSSALPVVFPLFLVACLDEVIRRSPQHRLSAIRRWFVAGCIGTAPFVVAVCLHNYLRFGDLFEHGYQDAVFRRYGLSELFAAKPLPTIAAVLFSPGKGLLWYCPALLIALLGFRSFYSRFPFVCLLCGVAAAGSIIFNSFFTIWAGDLAWGPRFQTSIIPLLLLPLAEVFESSASTLKRGLVYSILGLSLLVQSASVVYNFNLEFWQNPLHGPVPNEYTWSPRESHLLQRFRNIALHSVGTPDLSVEKFVDENPHIDKVNRSERQLRIAHSLNFFPFKARALLGGGTLILVLFCLWGALLLAAAYCSRILLSSLQLKRCELTPLKG